MNCVPDNDGPDAGKQAAFKKWTLFGWKEVEPDSIKPYQIIRITKPTGEHVMTGMTHCPAQIIRTGDDMDIRVHFYSTPSLLRKWALILLIVLIAAIGVWWAITWK